MVSCLFVLTPRFILCSCSCFLFLTVYSRFFGTEYLFLTYFDDIFRDTSEDSEPEGTLPSSKELEKETTKIQFATDLLSKSSLLEVEKDTEKETFAARDTVRKRHLLDMDMDTEETILVQTSLSSDWDRAPLVDIKSNVDASKIETVLDVEEVGTAYYYGVSIIIMCQRSCCQFGVPET